MKLTRNRVFETTVDEQFAVMVFFKRPNAVNGMRVARALDAAMKSVENGVDDPDSMEVAWNELAELCSGFVERIEVDGESAEDAAEFFSDWQFEVLIPFATEAVKGAVPKALGE